MNSISQGESTAEALVTAMLRYWVEVRQENATSEELQNALKILNKTSAAEPDTVTDHTVSHLSAAR